MNTDRLYLLNLDITALFDRLQTIGDLNQPINFSFRQRYSDSSQCSNTGRSGMPTSAEKDSLVSLTFCLVVPPSKWSLWKRAGDRYNCGVGASDIVVFGSALRLGFLRCLASSSLYVYLVWWETFGSISHRTKKMQARSILILGISALR